VIVNHGETGWYRGIGSRPLVGAGFFCGNVMKSEKEKMSRDPVRSYLERFNSLN